MTLFGRNRLKFGSGLRERFGKIGCRRRIAVHQFVDVDIVILALR